MTEEKKSWFTRVFKKDEPQKTVASTATPDASSDAAAKSTPEIAPTTPPETVFDTAPAATTETAPVLIVPGEAPEKSPDVSPDPLAAPDPVSKPSAKQQTEQAPEPSEDDLKDQQKAEQKSWFERLTAGLKKSASQLSDGISGIFTKRKLDDETLEELEDLLITTDLGVSVAARLTEALSKGRYNKEISPQEIKEVLASEIEAIITPVAKPLDINKGHKPHILLMTGVNGAGKTTTIGKLAKQFDAQGKSVMLAAADTFRAAAIEQLKVWGERAGVPVIAKSQGADAAAVTFEAVERAITDGIDILMVDTAGRLQNRDELMAELAKIVRVIERKLPGAPHDTLIVLDATTGQNAVMQVEAFREAAHVSGLIMTKLDGSARGGVLVACAEKFGLPIHAIGVGEGIDDLQAFSPKDFAGSLIGLGPN